MPGAPDACECDDELTTGDQCDQVLQCSAQSDASGERDTGACTTSASTSTSAVTRRRVQTGGASLQTTSTQVTCQCTKMRRIAVFATKVLPKIRREYGADYGSELSDMFASPPPALFIISVFLLIFLLTALAAYYADRRTLYVARAPPPFYPTTLTALFHLQLRIHMSVLRGFNIVPGFVAYTRLQVLVLAAIAVETNACCALLFGGTPSEMRTRHLLAPRTLPAGQDIMSSHLVATRREAVQSGPRPVGRAPLLDGVLSADGGVPLRVQECSEGR